MSTTIANSRCVARGLVKALEVFGAGEGIRTLDPDLGKVVPCLLLSFIILRNAPRTAKESAGYRLVDIGRCGKLLPLAVANGLLDPVDSNPRPWGIGYAERAEADREAQH